MRRWTSHRPSPGPVLLTGATGFLGRFMCLEWLERLAPPAAKLICLVRAADQDGRPVAAWPRCSRATTRSSSSASASSPPDHLEVVVGDVAEPRLGLDDAEFDRLAREVDRIVAPGGARQPRARLRGPVRPERRRHRRAGPAGADAPAEAVRLRVVGGDDVPDRPRRRERRGIAAAPDGRTQPGLQRRVRRRASGRPSSCCTAPTAASACRSTCSVAT